MENSADSRDEKRFVRWQGKLIEQSASVNNLLISLSLAVIGFTLSNERLTSMKNDCCVSVLLKFGIVLIVISIISGVVGSISRLHDFRATVKKINADIKKDAENSKHYKSLYRTYGKHTWLLLDLQLYTFLIGVIIITLFGFQIL